MSDIKQKTNMLGAISIIVGTCIGAGIFGLPYVISKVGVIIGITYLLVLGFITLITTLAYGEVVLRTKGTHQFPEYARIYLGPKIKKIAFFSLTIGFYGAMIAYLMEVSNFLFALLEPYLGGELLTYRLIYFVIISLIIFLGLGMIEKMETILVFVILIIIALLVIFGGPYIQINNIIEFDLHYLLLPYGVILFALSAASAVPDMKNILTNNREKLKKSIIIGIFIPLLVYIIFSLIVVGISGENTTESAVLGLQDVLGPVALTIGGIFGIVTMTTSFLALALVLKEVYLYDFKLNKYLSWLLVILPPLIIVMLNFLTFIEVIGISGALIGGIDGIIMIAMFNKAKKIGERKPEYEMKIPFYFSYIIYAVFVGGIAYEFYMVINKFFT